MNLQLRDLRRLAVAGVSACMLTFFTMLVMFWQPELALNIDMPRVGSVTWMLLRGVPLAGMLASLFGVWTEYRVYRRLALHYAPHCTTLHQQNGLRPPCLAEYLLHFLPKKTREHILGDLEGEYRLVFERFGETKAKLWYWGQVVTSFWPLLYGTFTKLIGWGAIAWLGNLIRRLIP